MSLTFGCYSLASQPLPIEKHDSQLKLKQKCSIAEKCFATNTFFIFRFFNNFLHFASFYGNENNTVVFSVVNCIRNEQK